MISLILSSVGFIAAIIIGYLALGIVVIGETQVGIVIKKMGGKSLQDGRIIALNGEAGIQAETLSPGWHFGYWFFMYTINKEKLVGIESGNIGVVVAIDGSALESNRIIAKQIDCSNYQDAKKFLIGGGQKGKQSGILTPGLYRINTALFQVNTVPLTVIENNSVGIVTTMDGISLQAGEIAGEIVPAHNSFQDPQKFIDNGGKRGLQEQIILAGRWNFNPWFASVKQVPMTHIPIGHVGVVTSYVGKAHLDISGVDFKHGDLVEEGRKGVWAKPLYPGMHPINVDTMKVDLVPTTNIVLNWATNRNEAHMLDKNLSSITVRSKDGFSYNLDVSVVIHIGALEASKVISRMGSVLGLISQVLEPTIGNYFRNSAQEFAALDFLKSRTEMQKNAARFVHEALMQYNVETVDTLIGDIVLPPELLATQTQRKLAEEMQKTYEVQQESQKQKEALNRQTAITEMQGIVVESEQEVKIAQQKAEAKVKTAEGDTKVAEQQALQRIRLAEGEAAQIQKKAMAEAEGIKAKGLAQAEAYKMGSSAMGQNNFALLETMTAIGREKLKIIPDLQVNGNGSGNTGIMDVLMAQIVKDKIEKPK